ncbi:MAG TPA: sigma-70 region 4 domain-containing protein, partial [Acidimicrobiales bacterium]
AQRRLEGLRALPPEERVPLVLVDAEGFSLEATARILGRSESETAADLTRARYRWRAFVVGDPAQLPKEAVVELPPPADDEAEPPPPAQLAEIDRAIPELGGHVKVVKPGAEPSADVAPAASSPSAASRRRSRGRGKATIAAATTDAHEPRPDEAAEN